MMDDNLINTVELAIMVWLGAMTGIGLVGIILEKIRRK